MGAEHVKCLVGRAVGSAVLGLGMGAVAASESLPAPQNASVVADPVARTVVVEGVIGPEFESDVRNALQRNPKIRRMVVRSPGGLRAQAMRVGEYANRRGVTVRVEGRCASACVLLWAKADSREMTTDSRIGLHRSSLDDALPIPDSMREQLMRRNDAETDEVLREAGFPARVVQLGAATPPTTMAWFSALELKVEGVPFVLLDRAPATAHAAGPVHGISVAGSSRGASADHE